MIARRRLALSALALLTLVPAVTTAPRVQAGGQIGSAQTDFTQVTPANAILYATIQSTAPSQPVNLRALGADFSSQPGFSQLLGKALAGSGSATSSTTQLLTQVTSIASHLFSGELGLAVLPLTYTTAANGTPRPQVHLLLDAGLQPGVNAAELRATFALLGLSGTTVATYHNLSIASLDLSPLLNGVAAGAGMTKRSTTFPTSSTVYTAVAGNDAVVASDLPTLKSAIDTYFGVRPSLAATYDFQTTISALPAARYMTLFVHLDTRQFAPLAGSLAALAQASGMGTVTLKPPKYPGTASEAFSVAAETDGILLTASPAVLTGSLAYNVGLTATGIGEPAFLPGDTLAYASIHDLGGLIQYGLSAFSGQALAQAGLTANPRKAFTSATGLDLDADILSWMHGDAGLAVLPVGSRDYGATLPLTHLSLVATLQAPNRAFVEAKLAKINAALLTQQGGQVLRLISVPGTPEDMLHMVASTPNGLGYTFYHGYLVLGTSLPADIATIGRTRTGQSLSASPLYQAAMRHVGPNPHGAVLFVDLTRVRTLAERLAMATGADLTQYDQARPLLSAFKSYTQVLNTGTAGGGAVFVGIGR